MQRSLHSRNRRMGHDPSLPFLLPASFLPTSSTLRSQKRSCITRGLSSPPESRSRHRVVCRRYFPPATSYRAQHFSRAFRRFQFYTVHILVFSTTQSSPMASRVSSRSLYEMTPQELTAQTNLQVPLRPRVGVQRNKNADENATSKLRQTTANTAAANRAAIHATKQSAVGPRRVLNEVTTTAVNRKVCIRTYSVTYHVAHRRTEHPQEARGQGQGV